MSKSEVAPEKAQELILIHGTAHGQVPQQLDGVVGAALEQKGGFKKLAFGKLHVTAAKADGAAIEPATGEAISVKFDGLASAKRAILKVRHFDSLRALIPFRTIIRAWSVWKGAPGAVTT